GAGQHFAPVARPRPTGDLVRAVAVFLVVGNGVVAGRQNHGGKQLARPLALLEVEGRAVDGVEHQRNPWYWSCLFCSPCACNDLNTIRGFPVWNDSLASGAWLSPHPTISGIR